VGGGSSADNEKLTDNPKIWTYPLSMLHSTLKITCFYLLEVLLVTNSKTDIFSTEESNTCLVAVLGCVKKK
jgi:hypothetical protein